MKTKTYSKAHVIPRSSGLKKLARSVSRRSHPAIARQVMRHPKTRATCLKVLEKDIQKELTKVASKKSGSSCLRQKTLGALQSFTWEKLHQELISKAPIFTEFLMAV